MNSTNVLDLDLFRRDRAEDELSSELSQAIEALLPLDLDEYPPEAKAQALVHLFEAQKLLV